MWLWVSLLLAEWVSLIPASGHASKKTGSLNPSVYELPIHMPAYQPQQNDDYVCTTVRVAEDGYILRPNGLGLCNEEERGIAVGYTPTAHADRVHHMLLYGCDVPGGQEGETWPCLHGQLCQSQQKILWAWARNAPAFTLPENVAFPIGKSSGYSNLVLQVHYATPLQGQVWDYSGVTLRMSPQPTPFSAAVFIFVGMMDIPPETSTFFMNISCQYKDSTQIHPFAFRTHTHGLGRLVSAAVKDPEDGHWDVIGKRNPQWPQLFQKIPDTEQLTISKKDFIAAQCRYDSSERHRMTHTGLVKDEEDRPGACRATGHDEMCNFYMMYYWKTGEPAPWMGQGGSCAMDQYNLFQGDNAYPAKASELLPPSPLDEEHAKQASISFGHARRRRQWETGQMPSRRRGYPDDAYSDWPKEPGRLPLATPNRVFHVDHAADNARLDKQSSATGGPGESANSKPKQAPGTSQRVKEVAKWNSAGSVAFGQVSGLALNGAGNLLVFHRGPVVWGPGSFDNGNRLQERTPINVPTVVEMNPKTGALVSSWGKGKFYMPHGISVDKDGNVWTTDVGLHQVQKWSKKGKALMSLGEAFVPGSDRSHFCKPAAVAVNSKGDIFIADGYCNRRVIVFNKDGTYQREFGQKDDSPRVMDPPLGYFNLPHDITLHEQNGRVQMLFTNGTAIRALKPSPDFATVYSTDYCSHDGNVFLMPGEPATGSKQPIKAFSVNSDSGKVAFSFAPSSGEFSRPHVMRASGDCGSVFVGEIAGSTGTVWRFDILSDSPSKEAAPAAPDGGAASVSANSQLPIVPTLVKRKEGGLGLLGTIAVLVLVFIFIASSVCICLRCRNGKRGRRSNLNLQNISNGVFDKGNRSHKGFQPLRTEDIDAMDDITDESEDDDLYSAPTRQRNR